MTAVYMLTHVDRGLMILLLEPIRHDLRLSDTQLGFVTGPAAIDGIMVALQRLNGNTNGVRLAAAMEKFKNVPTISGRVSFSRQLHTVFGRSYRVIRVENNTPRVLTTVKAKVIPKI